MTVVLVCIYKEYLIFFSPSSLSPIPSHNLLRKPVTLFFFDLKKKKERRRKKITVIRSLSSSPDALGDGAQDSTLQNPHTFRVKHAGYSQQIKRTLLVYIHNTCTVFALPRQQIKASPHTGQNGGNQIKRWLLLLDRCVEGQRGQRSNSCFDWPGVRRNRGVGTTTGTRSRVRAAFPISTWFFPRAPNGPSDADSP